MSWDNIFKGAVILVGTTFLTLFALWVTANKSVVRYYVDNPNGMSSELGYSCVVAEIQWDTDTKVFCSTDSEKVLDYMNKANSGLKK